MKLSLQGAFTGATVFLLALATALAAPSATQAQEMSSVDRRLLVAVTSYAFDERAALEALAAGADINGRNPAMDNDTLLIAAIRQFKDGAVIQWLIDHRANPTLSNKLGRNAASYFRQYRMDKTAAGRAVLARLEGGAALSGAPLASPAGSRNQPSVPAGPVPAPVPARAPTNVNATPASANYGPPVPGVYECMNQQAMISPMAFGLIDETSFTTSGGRRGRYTYSAGILTLDSGASAARYQRTGPNLFRPLLANGQLGGFTCPLNRAKSPTRLPW